MSEPALQADDKKACTLAERLYLDEWIRDDISSKASNQDNAALLRKLPFRQVVRYCIARRMAATLEHVAHNSRHYAEKFKKNPGLRKIEQIIRKLRQTARLCLTPHDLKTAGLIELEIGKVITALPFTWPEELAAEPESFLAVSHSEVEGVISQLSSGSTGPGKRIFCSARDQESTIHFFMNGMRHMVEPKKGDRVALMMSSGGRGRGNLAELYTEAMRRIDVLCLLVSNPNDECLALKEMAEFAPSCIVATPRQFCSVIRSRSDAICPDADEYVLRIKSGLKNVLFSGDRISSAMRDILIRELGADIFLHYGLVEAGIGTAVECPCHDGEHYREGDFLIEIMSADGVSYPSPLPVRQTTYIDHDDHSFRLFGPTPWGEITITSLTREASPLIRYRTGDTGRIIVDKCRCGSEVFRLEVRGRQDEFIQLPVLPGERGTDMPRLMHSSFDRCLLFLPWVKDHQVIVQTVEPAASIPENLGIILLLNSAAPAAKQALNEICEALAPVEYRLNSHKIGLYVSIARNRPEFEKLFAYGPKRLFMHTVEPFDDSVYRKL